ncbi:hypothetical protein [Streptomyces sp. NPDC058086]
MHPSIHLAWGWNGTLFDNTAVVVASANAAFTELDAGPLTTPPHR